MWPLRLAITLDADAGSKVDVILQALAKARIRLRRMRETYE